MDDPAIEINPVFSERIPLKFREISNKENQTPRLGPCSVKINPVRCSLYPIHTHGMVLGMVAGEVLHWNLDFDRARNITLMGHHKGTVTSLQSSGGKDILGDDLVISGSSDGTAKIWKGCSGARKGTWECLQTLYGHGGSVLSIECVKNNIITAGTDCKVRVWCLVEGRKLLQNPWFEFEGIVATMDGWVRDMCCLDREKIGQEVPVLIASGSADIIQLVPKGRIDLTTRRLKAKLEWTALRAPNEKSAHTGSYQKLHERGITLIKCMPEVCTVCTASYDNCLRVYSIKSLSLIHCWENENGCLFTGILYDSSNCQVITADMRGYMAIYCLKKERMLATKQVTGSPIVGFHLRHKHDDLIVVIESGITVWKINRDVHYNVVRGGHTGPVISLYTCSGGKKYVSREQDYRIFSASLDNTLRLWDPHDLGCLRCVVDAQSEISSMTFCEEEDVVIAGHDSGVIYLWNMDIQSFTQLDHHKNTVTALKMACVHQNQELLISAGYDGVICVWDVATTRGAKPHLVGRIGENIQVHLPENFNKGIEILCLEYHTARRVIFAGGNDCEIRAWSIVSYQYVGRHIGHSDPVYCMAMDSNFLFSGSEDCTIRVWDALPATSIGPCVSSHPFSGGTLLKTLEGHKGTITGVSVMCSSGHLVSGSLDGCIMVWDYVAGKVLRRHNHCEELLCLALRFDADEIIAGTRQGNILQFSAGESVGLKQEMGMGVSLT